MLTPLRVLIRTGLTVGLARRGYEMRSMTPPEPEDIERARFGEAARIITRRHEAQSREDVSRLRSRYDRPIYGRIEVWTLMERLGRCIDPSDVRLYGARQHLHVLQVLAAMEADGVTDSDLLLAALVHDVGKLRLLIGEHEPGIGLDRCAPLMDARDREYTERHLRRFQHYDQGSKSLFAIPHRTLDHYRELLGESLPRAILF
jgi:hypothetical protein